MVERLGLSMVGGQGGFFNGETLEKGLRSVPVVVDGGEGDYLWRGGGGGISVPNVLFSCPINYSLVYFVITMLTNELCPLMLSHPCFRWPRSLHFLPWSTTSL